MRWEIVTPEEEAAREAAKPPEVRAEEERRAAFDAQHPRCGECGQFLRRSTNLFGPEWESHFYRSSWEYNEWDHK